MLNSLSTRQQISRLLARGSEDKEEEEEETDLEVSDEEEEPIALALASSRRRRLSLHTTVFCFAKTIKNNEVRSGESFEEFRSYMGKL